MKKLEQIKTVNIRLSMELRPGQKNPDLLKRALRQKVHNLAEMFSGDDGPRFDVSVEPDTIVELDPDHEPYWKTIDVEPIRRRRAR